MARWWRVLLGVLGVACLADSVRGEPAPLAVSANVTDGRWLKPGDPLELTLSRSIDATAERLAITIGRTDWTALFVVNGTVLRYQAGPVALPRGESSLTVFRVTLAEGWQSIGQFSLRVLTPRGFERSEAAPTMGFENKGQVAEAHSGDAPAPPRETFQDATFTLGMRTAHVKNGITAASQVNLLGVSHVPEALRFQAEGNDAPRLDLADYLVDVESRRAKVSLGHLLFTSHRHLMPRFASRGVSARLRAGRADLTLAALNGNSIVGFDNPLGVGTRNNRLWVATVGAELARQAGAARVEALAVSGTRQARTGFAQGQVNDVERGHGVSLRFASAVPGSRVRFDAGLARNRFEAPGDPLLAQGATLVPLGARSSDAAYVDTGYELLRPGAEAGKNQGRLTATYRFERVDPLFRPIGAPEAVRADVLLHTAELSGGWGALLGQVAHTWAHDNLGRVASLLTTDTGTTIANVALPLGAVRTGSPPSTPWWPLVTYTLNRTSQVGGAIPADGGFASEAQVPDQRNALQTLRSDWTFARVRFGYAAAHTLVDNRQPGRERADFDTFAQTGSLGFTAGTALDLGLEIGRERVRSVEAGSSALTRRIAVNGSWRPTSRATIILAATRTSLRDPAASEGDIDDVMLEGSHTIAMPRMAGSRPRARVFTRWTWQSADIVQILFGATQVRRNWTLATGLSLSVF